MSLVKDLNKMTEVEIDNMTGDEAIATVRDILYRLEPFLTSLKNEGKPLLASLRGIKANCEKMQGLEGGFTNVTQAERETFKSLSNMADRIPK